MHNFSMFRTHIVHGLRAGVELLEVESPLVPMSFNKKHSSNKLNMSFNRKHSSNKLNMSFSKIIMNKKFTLISMNKKKIPHDNISSHLHKTSHTSHTSPQNISSLHTKKAYLSFSATLLSFSIIKTKSKNATLLCILTIYVLQFFTLSFSIFLLKKSKSEKSLKRGKVNTYAFQILEGIGPNSFNQSCRQYNFKKLCFCKIFKCYGRNCRKYQKKTDRFKR